MIHMHVTTKINYGKETCVPIKLHIFDQIFEGVRRVD